MTALVQVKIDKELKEQADSLFNELGLDTTTAIRMFLKQAINKGGLPFSIRRKKRDYDAEFYNEENVRILKDGYQKLLNGEGEVRELIDE